jgi:hypothetical protein
MRNCTRDLLFLSLIILGNMIENTRIIAGFVGTTLEPIVLINDKSSPINISISVEGKGLGEVSNDSLIIHTTQPDASPDKLPGITMKILSTNSNWKNETIIVRRYNSKEVLCKKDFGETGNESSRWPRIHFYPKDTFCVFEE